MCVVHIILCCVTLSLLVSKHQQQQQQFDVSAPAWEISATIFIHV